MIFKFVLLSPIANSLTKTLKNFKHIVQIWIIKKEIEKIKKKIIPILKKHKVTRAGIFGSYARGEQKKESDVDILIEINDSVGLTGLIELKLNLEKHKGEFRV